LGKELNYLSSRFVIAGIGIFCALSPVIGVTLVTVVSAGYGKKGLKNPADPFAAENRRVQVSNVAARDEASR
jgi:hypothetical protein